MLFFAKHCLLYFKNYSTDINDNAGLDYDDIGGNKDEGWNEDNNGEGDCGDVDEEGDGEDNNGENNNGDGDCGVVVDVGGCGNKDEGWNDDNNNCEGDCGDVDEDGVFKFFFAVYAFINWYFLFVLRHF